MNLSKRIRLAIIFKIARLIRVPIDIQGSFFGVASNARCTPSDSFPKEPVG